MNFLNQYRAESKEDLAKILEKLFLELENISNSIVQEFNSKTRISMILIEQEELEFQNGDICFISEREFKYSDNDDFVDLPEEECNDCIDPDDMVDENDIIGLYYSDDLDDKIDKCKKVRDH